MPNESNNVACEPTVEFRNGNVKASVWRTEKQGKNGETYRTFSVKVDKRYKDEQGNWHSSSSFFVNELPRAWWVLERAYDWIIFDRDGK